MGGLREKIYALFLKSDQRVIQSVVKRIVLFAKRVETFCQNKGTDLAVLRHLGALRSIAHVAQTRDEGQFVAAMHEGNDLEKGLRLIKAQSGAQDTLAVDELLKEWGQIREQARVPLLKIQMLEWIETIAVALLLAFIIRTSIVQPFKIPTGSMQETLMPGDFVMVNKFIYGAKIPALPWHLPAIRHPQRGDVIVFIYPEDPKKDFIKRLVGLPGETLEIKNESVYINGRQLLDSPFHLRHYYNRGTYGAEGRTLLIPEHRYFMLGDNSNNSQDSRYWGFVPEENILGKAILIYWPPQRIRIIK